MRLILAMLAPLMSVSPTPSPPSQALPDRDTSQSQVKSPVNCQGKIEAVREERGLPMLQRDSAASDEPLFVLAVAKSVDRCQVLVMANDRRDIRPLPEYSEGPGRFQRIR